MKTLRMLCAGFGLLAAICVQAQVPQLISYQGRVGASGTNFSGTGQFKFALANGSGTVSFWSNDGTSVGGSEPAAAVALNVSQGLFTVLLGDATLPNMTVIPAAIFMNSDVRVRIWFNDGVNGFAQLSPDQRIAAVGYAMMAASVADGSITAAKLADGSIPASKLAPGAAQQSLQEIGQSGVASGGIILSADPDSQSLSNAGYTRIGSAEVVRESWQLLQGHAPNSRADHTAIWTGSEIIIWGGFDGKFTFSNDGAAYNPTLNRWRPIATNTFLAPRRHHSAIWTGTHMIIWGGSYLRNEQPLYFNDGAAYDPVANLWQPLNATNIPPSARALHKAIWTGAEMIIWGGQGSNTLDPSGVRFQPATGGWTPLPTLDAPSAGPRQAAVWTGAEMIVWSGGGGALGGGRYHLGSNKWFSMAFITAPA